MGSCEAGYLFCGWAVFLGSFSIFLSLWLLICTRMEILILIRDLDSDKDGDLNLNCKHGCNRTKHTVADLILIFNEPFCFFQRRLNANLAENEKYLNSSSVKDQW